MEAGNKRKALENMKKKIVTLSIVLAIFVFVAGCIGNGNSQIQFHDNQYNIPDNQLK